MYFHTLLSLEKSTAENTGHHFHWNRDIFLIKQKYIKIMNKKKQTTTHIFNFHRRREEHILMLVQKPEELPERNLALGLTLLPPEIHRKVALQVIVPALWQLSLHTMPGTLREKHFKFQYLKYI